METFKTILLIAFIVGIVGAINAIITQSKNPNAPSAVIQLSKVLGFAPKTAAEPGRTLNYVPGQLKPQSGQQSSPATSQTSQPSQTNTAPSSAPRTFSLPTPTPIPSATPRLELPPLPPIQANTIPQTMGAKDISLPPLPPVGGSSTLGIKYPTVVPSPQPTPNLTNPENTVYDTVASFLEETYRSFGF